MAVILTASLIGFACSDKPTGPSGPLPTITSISPSYGFPTIIATISGEDFGADNGTILFGDVSAAIVSWSDSLVTTIIPNVDGEVEIELKNSSDRTFTIDYYVLTAAEFLDSLSTKNSMEISFRGDNSYYSYYHYDGYDPVITYDTIRNSSLILIGTDMSDNEIIWTGNTFSLDYDSTAEILHEYDTLSHHISGSVSDNGREIDSVAANYLMSRWASYYKNRVSIELDAIHIAIAQIGVTIVYSFRETDLEDHIKSIENYAYEYHLMTMEEFESYYLNTDWNSSQIEPWLSIKFYQGH